MLSTTLQDRKMEITEDDIKRAEILFFNGNGTFEDTNGERYSFISNITESIDVEACPGSGKTTCLLAKLYILSEKMNFEDGKGICVLTHTNVAIDEIKKRLGSKAERLFQYPNFFGTIQSFVDRYLAIPYYSLKNGRHPITIDSERATNRLFGTYSVNKCSGDNLNKVKIFLYQPNGVANKLTIGRNESDQIELLKGVDGKKVEIKAPKNQDWSTVSLEDLYQTLFRLKLSVLKDSAVLSFDDAYFYANEYLSNYPLIKNAIKERFGYVFIDEMQDTYTHQNEIINSIFDENIIVQRIGDSNQAILNDSNSISAWEKSERFRISGSRRFSPQIAKILRTVALNGDEKLTGSNQSSIQPHIISYEEGNEPKVLEAFSQLIKELELDGQNQKYPIKAIGWVGKEKESLTIGNYFEDFSKAIKSTRVKYSNLAMALSICDGTTPRFVRDTVLDCCIEILKISEITNTTSGRNRHYNRTSFLSLIKQNKPEVLMELNERISEWAPILIEGNSKGILIEIRNYLKDYLFQPLGFAINADNFINSDEMTIINENQLESNNTFNSSTEGLEHIKVKIDTVHAVKGETHLATLYLETYYQGKTCGEYLIEQLKGIPYSQPTNQKDSYKKSCLKIAHVAMSRPTHLLAFALNKSIVRAHREGLEGNGWKIIEA